MAYEGAVAVEDPYRLEADGEFTRIQGEAELPIILDTHCPTVRDAKIFCNLGARAIALKPGRAGLSECIAMADIARAHGCAVHVGIAGESELGSLTALGLTQRLTQPVSWLPSETTFFLMLGERITVSPLSIANGRIALPNVAGLAEVVDWERVEHFQA